jgi:hypothetical protein
LFCRFPNRQTTRGTAGTKRESSVEYEFRFKMPDDMRLAEPEALRIGSNRSIHSMTLSSDILALSHGANDVTTIDTSEIHSPKHSVSVASVASLITMRNALSGAALSAFVICGLFIGLRGTPPQEQRALTSSGPAALALIDSSNKAADKIDVTPSTVVQFADRTPGVVQASPSFIAPVSLPSPAVARASEVSGASDVSVAAQVGAQPSFQRAETPLTPALQMVPPEPQKWVAGSINSQSTGTAPAMAATATVKTPVTPVTVATAAPSQVPANGLAIAAAKNILADEPSKKDTVSDVHSANPAKSSQGSTESVKTKKPSSKLASITPSKHAVPSAHTSKVVSKASEAPSTNLASSVARSAPSPVASAVASVASSTTTPNDATAAQAPEKGRFLQRKINVEAAASTSTTTPATDVADRQRIF